MEQMTKVIVFLALIGALLNTLVLILGIMMSPPVQHFVDYALVYSGLGLMCMFAGAMGVILKYFRGR